MLIKKITSAILAVAMVASMSVTVFASEGEDDENNIKTVTADESEAVNRSMTRGRSDFTFDMFPGNEAWGAYGSKDDSNVNATITVEYALDASTLYYRVASAANTNSFISETKNVTGPYVFNLRYDANQNRPRSTCLRGYQPASETRMVAQAGFVIY